MAPIQGPTRGTGNTNSGTFTVTLGQTPQNGNTLFLAYVARSETSGAQPTIDHIDQTNVAWASKSIGGGSEIDIEIWKGIVSGSAGTTITVTVTGGAGATPVNIADVCEFPGVATFDQGSYLTGAGDTLIDTGTTPPTTQNVTLVIAACGSIGYGYDFGSHSAPIRGTLLDGTSIQIPGGSGNYGALSFIYYTTSVIGQQNNGVTVSSDNHAIGGIAAFKMVVGTAGSKAISGRLVIRRKSSKALSSKLTLHTPPGLISRSKALSSSLIVRHRSPGPPFDITYFDSRYFDTNWPTSLSSSFFIGKGSSEANLRCSFTIRNYGNLSSSFKIRNNPGSKAVSSSVTLRKRGVKDGHGRLTIGHRASKDLRSSLTVQKSSPDKIYFDPAYYDPEYYDTVWHDSLSSSLTVRFVRAANFRNSITVRQRGSKALSCKFVVVKSNVHGSFTLRKRSSKALSSKLFLNKSKGSRDLSSKLTLRGRSSKALSSSLTPKRLSVNFRCSLTVHGAKSRALSSSLTLKPYRNLSSSLRLRRKNSKALSSSLYVRKLVSANMPSKLVLRGKSSKALACSITVKKLSVNYRCRFTVRNRGSEDLSSSLHIGYRTNANVSLRSSLSLRLRASVNLLSSLKVMEPGSTNLHSKLTVRKLTSKALSGSVTIRKLGGKNIGHLSLTVRKTNSTNLPGRLTIRKKSTTTLPCSFTVLHGPSLPGSLTVRKRSSSNMSTSLTIRKRAVKDCSCSLIVYRPFAQLSSSFSIQRNAHARGRGSVTIRNERNADLSSSLSVITTVDLSSSFTIGSGPFGYVNLYSRTLVQALLTTTSRGQVGTWSEANT